jgi:hypothetical protein
VRAKPTNKTMMALVPISAPVYCGSMPVVQNPYRAI